MSAPRWRWVASRSRWHAATAADLGLSRRVVLLIYDVGLYEGALDRAMAQADRGGVYAGESSAARARNRVATRKAMLGQRDAVLNAAAAAVAARATDPELNELLRAATAAGCRGGNTADGRGGSRW